jgi:ABC-type glycerol-3-phosphate transport system permease component
MISLAGATEGSRESSPRVSRAVAVKRLKAVSLNGTGVLVALVTLFPIAWMVSTAFKPSQEIFSLTPDLTPAHPTLGNFAQVISGQASGIGSVWLFFRNSIAVTWQRCCWPPSSPCSLLSPSPGSGSGSAPRSWSCC